MPRNTTESLEKGACSINSAIRPELTQQHGFAHAGVDTTLADTAAGYAAYSMMPEDSSVLTVEFKVNLMKPAAGQALRAEARTINPGRTLSVVGANVFAIHGDDEALAARMQATMMQRLVSSPLEISWLLCRFNTVRNDIHTHKDVQTKDEGEF